MLLAALGRRGALKSEAESGSARVAGAPGRGCCRAYPASAPAASQGGPEPAPARPPHPRLGKRLRLSGAG